MARRASLTEAGITRPSQALSPPSAPAADSKRSPARQGKKAVAFWTDPASSQQLRMAAISLERSIQSIMEEALEDWFRKHRLPRLAANGGAEPRSAA